MLSTSFFRLFVSFLPNFQIFERLSYFLDHCARAASGTLPGTFFRLFVSFLPNFQIFERLSYFLDHCARAASGTLPGTLPQDTPPGRHPLTQGPPPQRTPVAYSESSESSPRDMTPAPPPSGTTPRGWSPRITLKEKKVLDISGHPIRHILRPVL